MTFDEWCAEFNRRMSYPNSDANLAIEREWARLEGMFHPQGLHFDRGFNPWMTTQEGLLSGENIGFGPGRWNSVGVKMYATAEAGLQATIATFRQGDGPTYYGALDAAFKSQVWTPACARSWQIWIVGPNAAPDQHGYDQNLSDFARERWLPSMPTLAPVSREEYENLVLALFAGSEQRYPMANPDGTPHPRAGQTMTRTDRLAEARYRIDSRAAGTEQSLLEIAASRALVVPSHQHELNIAVSQTGPVKRG